MGIGSCSPEFTAHTSRRSIAVRPAFHSTTDYSPRRRSLNCPERVELPLSPGEHRLLELVDARVPSVQHFAELIDDGSGRRMDQARSERPLDHRVR